MLSPFDHGGIDYDLLVRAEGGRRTGLTGCAEMNSYGDIIDSTERQVRNGRRRIQKEEEEANATVRRFRREGYPTC